MNVLAAVAGLEHLRLVTRAFAFFADQLNIGEELHFHRNRAVALAGFTPPSGNVERKMPGSETALLGLRQRSKEFADGVERLDVSHRIRPRGSPDRRLIDQHDFINELVAFQTFPGSRSPRRARGLLLLAF